MPSMGELISSARARSIRKAALSEEPRAPESERPQCAMGAQWATAAPIAFTPMATIAQVCRAVPLRMCQMEARAYVPAFGPTLAERPTARADERRAGKACGSTGRYRWAADHSKKKT